jgi:hypothetical protein
LLFEFLSPAVVAGFVDQAFGLGQIALGEVVVGEVQPHAGAGGDAENFIEVRVGAAGEEGPSKKFDGARAAEEVDGLVEVMSGFRRAGAMGAAEREMVEADVQRPELLLGD